MTSMTSTELEPAVLFPAKASTELAQIRAALMRAGMGIANIHDTPVAATQWLAVDIIARDLAVLRRDLSNRLIELAPTKTYKYTPKGGVQEERTKPVKEQVVDGLGVVLIETSMNRDWNDKRALAHEMIGDLARIYASDHEGEMPNHTTVVSWLFDIFAVGDPRVTKMEEYGLKSYDNDDNCAKNPTTTARVKG